MAELSWMDSSLSSDDGMLALQGLLGQDSFNGLTNGLSTSPTETKVGLKDKATAMGVANTTGNISPPEISPSPPSSSNGTSPANTVDPRARRNDSDPLALPAKRKGDDQAAADEVEPSHKNRRASQNYEGEAALDGKGGQGKTTDRRKEQNRNAQRAFRERREKRLHELEDQINDLQQKQETSASENANLRDIVARLKAENTRLSAFEQAFTFNMATSASATLAQTRPSLPQPEAKPADEGSSTDDFAALIRSVQKHLGNAVHPDLAPNGTSQEIQPAAFGTLKGLTPSTGSSSASPEVMRVNASASPPVVRSNSGSTPASTSSGPAAQNASPAAWSALDYIKGDDAGPVGDLTFLNDWNSTSMSLLDGGKAAAAPTASLGGFSNGQVSTEFADLMGTSSSGAPWDFGSTSWATTSGPSSTATASIGTPDALSLLLATSSPSDPLDLPAPAPAPAAAAGEGPCPLSEPELDGLCEMMKSKATCKERTAYLEKVIEEKPHLGPHVEVLKAKRWEELERSTSIAGGIVTT